MKHTQLQKYSTHISVSCAVLLGVIAFTLGTNPNDTKHSYHSSAEQEVQSSCGDVCEMNIDGVPARTVRLAQRLQDRVFRTTGKSYSVGSMVKALQERDELLAKTVTVNVQEASGSGSRTAKWEFKVADHRAALFMNMHWMSATFEIDRNALMHMLTHHEIADMQELSIAEVSSIKHDGFLLRGEAEVISRAGFAYNMEELADKIISAIDGNDSTIALALPYDDAYVVLKTDTGEQRLTLLGTGMSDWSDSPENRVSNVKKAFNERVNNTVVAPGDEYSFVATLGGPVTLQKGWKEALGLFGGGTAMTPGGGICQAATTVFRGALLSGLPITYKRNHSVYVDHYEPFGVGLDATIFPGVHDLSFKNDTESYVVVQSYLEGDLAYVNMYGIDDGRTVVLDGPYFMNTKPRAKELGPLGKDQIGWVQHVTYPDGTVKTKPLVATYSTGFMRSVTQTYAGVLGTKLLHMSAPQHDLASN